MTLVNGATLPYPKLGYMVATIQLLIALTNLSFYGAAEYQFPFGGIYF